MWGYSCGAAVAGSTASCAKLNPGPRAGWSPVVITVPTGQGLQINLDQQSVSSAATGIPTSLTIVGQLGGGLGKGATTTPSPTHDVPDPHMARIEQRSWMTARTLLLRRDRACSRSLRKCAAGNTVPVALTWTTPRDGHVLARVGHASLDSGADGSLWHGGRDRAIVSTGRHP